jgi:prepilin signal peptidase PulO-like enzyme (type II secretory pathway)
MTVPHALLALTPALAALLTTVHRQRHAWAHRDITPVRSWRATTAVAILASTLATAATATMTGPWPAASVGAMAFLAVIAVSTDLASRKIPRDLPHVAALTALAHFALSEHRSLTALIALTVSTVGLVVLPWIARALTRNGLGFSDIRLLWAFTTALAWWTGPNILVWALIGACLTQLLAHPAAAVLGWGRTVPVPDKDGTDTGRTRTELPFAPALCAAFLAAAGYAAITGASACSALSTC